MCFLISTQFLSGFLSGDSTFRGVELAGMSSIDLPAGVLDAIAAPPADREPIVRQELAVSLYRAEYLSFGTARELAGLSKASPRTREPNRTAKRTSASARYRRIAATPTPSTGGSPWFTPAVP